MLQSYNSPSWAKWQRRQEKWNEMKEETKIENNKQQIQRKLKKRVIIVQTG